MLKFVPQTELHFECRKCSWRGLIGRFEIVERQRKGSVRRCPACGFRAHTKTFRMLQAEVY